MRHVWSLKSSPGLDLISLKNSDVYKAVLQSGVLLPANEWVLERAVREIGELIARLDASGDDGSVVGGRGDVADAAAPAPGPHAPS